VPAPSTPTLRMSRTIGPLDFGKKLKNHYEC